MKKITLIIMCICILSGGIISAYGAEDSNNVRQNTVVALGIMTGDENGNLNLTNNVTRAEFTKMLIKASVYRDSVQEGSGASPFKDVKYTHWASDYIKAAVDAKWMVGYVDGTFRPANTITFEEAASAILRLLGYESSDLSGTYPSAQISKFNALKLSEGISPVQGQPLSRRECMYIFYNLMGTTDKNGSVYGVSLGYTMNSAGKIDYEEILKTDIEGPYVLKDTTLEAILPFSADKALIYRDSSAASLEEAQRYDVVYYNANSKNVWLYSNKAIGTYTAASPDTVSPLAVTVAGNSYNLGTSAAKNKVSTSGEFSAGDTVALLLGMDGEAVDIIPASEVDGVFYGVVTKVELSTYAVDSSKSKMEYVLSVACTDGIVRQCAVDSDSYKTGRVVSVSYIKGKLTVGRPGSSSMSGVFSLDGKKLGNYMLSEDVQILDISEDGQWAVIYPSRLSGVTLRSGSIHHYALNSKNEISHLILNNVTGDMYDYGILTGVQELEIPSAAGERADLSGTYEYIVNGAGGVLNVTNVHYNVEKGPAIFYYKDGKINGMRNLDKLSIDELSYLTAYSGNQKYVIADNVQVYLRSKSYNYSLTDVSALNTDEYTITGYYENIYPAGRRIRLIIADKKD